MGFFRSRPLAKPLALALTILGMSSVAMAEVVFTGTVNPNDPTGVDSTTTVTIGPTSSSPGEADPRGGIEVNGGSQFTAGRVLVGDSIGALAKMVLTGPQTKATVTSNGSFNAPSLIVGANGSGYLRVDDGAWLQVGGSQSGVLTIATTDGSDGIGSIEVVGESTLVTVGRQLVVSGGNLSSLDVRDGAVVRVASVTGGVEDAVLIDGAVELTGDRTELQTYGLTVGSRLASIAYPAVGSLRVAEGAVVRSVDARITSRAFVGYGGSIELDGGTLAMTRLELEGQLSGSGEVTGFVAVDSTGRIEVGEGESLQINGPVEVAGRVRVLGGQLDVGGLVFRNEGYAYRSVEVELADLTVRGIFNSNVEGTIRLKDSTFTVLNANTSSSYLPGDILAEKSIVRLESPATYLSRGNIELIDSELLLTNTLVTEGTTSDPSSLVIGGSTIRRGFSTPTSTHLSIGDLFEIRGQNNKVEIEVRTSPGGLVRVADGASVDFASATIASTIDIGAGSSVHFSERASLFYEVAIALSDSNLMTPSIIGAKQLGLGNKLVIDASAVSEIAVGQEYLLFEADSLGASFNTYSFPDLPGTLEFVPQLTETEFSLLVIDAAVTLPGDYNADGCVDAADYTVLRDSEMHVTNRMAMATWQTNYGRWLPGSGMPIPEPTAAVLFAIGLTAAAALRR